MRLLFSALLLPVLACSSPPTDPVQATDGTFTLRFGQTATIAGKRVTFADIADSRCPRDVNCVWEGDAAVRLESGNEHVVLHTSQTAGPTSAALAGVSLTLVEVKPERLRADEAPKKSEYVVTLRTSQ